MGTRHQAHREHGVPELVGEEHLGRVLQPGAAVADEASGEIPAELLVAARTCQEASC